MNQLTDLEELNGWEEADLSLGIVQGTFLQRITHIVRDESIDFDVRARHLNYLLTAIESRKRIWEDEYFDANNFPTITGQYAALVNRYRDAELEDSDDRRAFIREFIDVVNADDIDFDMKMMVLSCLVVYIKAGFNKHI